MILSNVPVVEEPCSSNLDLPLERHVSSFQPWRWIVRTYMSDDSYDANVVFFCHLILFSFFLPPLYNSTVTGTYLWDICRKVGISMWKGSCRQYYALCIHSICMKCSRCHSCKPVIWWQYFRQSRGSNLKKTHEQLLYLYKYMMHTWNTHHIHHPKKHQMKKYQIYQNCLRQQPGRTDRQVARVNEEEVVFFLPRHKTGEQ